MFKLYNASLEDQINGLSAFIKANEKVWHVLTNAHRLNLPQWYVGAGCLVQTVWNIQSNFTPDFGIKDIDLIYFDPTNLSKEREKQIENQVRAFFSEIPLEIDVKNQARVHCWYEQKFGYSINPYSSSEAAINTWPTTATSIAMRSEGDGSLLTYAPYGLNDVYGLIARANKTQITNEIYQTKVTRWKSYWPSLTIIPWEKC